MAMWLELIKPRFVSMLFTTSYAKWELFDKDIILIREEMFEGGTMSVPEGGNTPGRKMLLPPPCTSTVGAALIGSGLHSCSSAGFSLEEGEKKVWSFCLFFFFHKPETGSTRPPSSRGMPGPALGHEEASQHLGKERAAKMQAEGCVSTHPSK